MNRLLRKGLQIVAHPDGEQIHCSACSHTYGPPQEDWRKKAKRRLLPPTAAGPYREELLGRFSLQQYTCPSCGMLLETEMVDVKG
jgi:acetone carboxylase gamma subunit